MTAAEFLRSNPRVATALSARDIEEFIPAGIRQQSFFSARTVYAHHLDETQTDISALLEGRMGANEIRNRMQDRLEKLGYAPDDKDKGGLRDLSSDARTNLIIDMQEQRARGYAVWRSQQSEAILKVWPANEMYRALARKVPRDWKTRWNAARASLGEASTTATYALTQDGPFIALKNDPIWSAVSRFGSPWPPFDYQSGMRLKQVKASAARAAGVLKPGAEGPKPARDPMRRVESASCSGMSEPIVRKWAEAFGERARVVDGRVLVVPEPSVIDEVLEAAAGGAKAEAVFGFVPETVVGKIDALFPGRPLRPATVFKIDADHVRHVRKSHGEGTERQADQRPVSDDDFRHLPEMLAGPGSWRASTEKEKGDFLGDAATFLSAALIVSAWKISRNRSTPHLSLITMLAKK